MKLSTFQRTTKFYPESLGNKDLPEADKFYIDINTLALEDHFEINALMIRAKQIHDAGDEFGDIQVPNPKNPDELLTIPSPQKALKRAESAKEVIKGFGEIATRYCTVHNLTGADGTPITIQDFMRYPDFGETIMEVMNHILGVSTPDEDDQKNS